LLLVVEVTGFDSGSANHSARSGRTTERMLEGLATEMCSAIGAHWLEVFLVERLGLLRIGVGY
jgi:hypothetical protein